jgi:hypothetical protein
VVDEAVASCRFCAGADELEIIAVSRGLDDAVGFCHGGAGGDGLDIAAVVSRSLAAGRVDEAVASCRTIPSAADELALDSSALFRLSRSLSTGEVDEDIKACRPLKAGAD